MADPILTIDDVANIRAIPAAIAANPGAIAIENVAGTLKQVDDQGVATNLGAGGVGTVTSVAATAGGLLAVAGTPTVAPTVGIAAMAANTIIANATSGSAVPTAASATAVRTILGVQPSTAVAITGGTIAGTNINRDVDWYAARAAEQAALMPALTRWKRIPCGLSGTAITPVTTGTAGEGGSLNGPSGAVAVFSNNVFYKLKTVGGAVSFRCIFEAPVGGRVAFIGAHNAANSVAWVFGTDGTFDATHLMFRTVNTGGGGPLLIAVASTFVITAGQAIDVTFVKDATTLTLMVNGTTVATDTDLTYMTDEAMQLYIFNTTLNDVQVTDGLIGMV